MTLFSVAILALAIGCAYSNAIFLPNPKKVLRAREAQSVAILLGVVVINGLLLFLTKFDLLIAFLVWLPALTGVVSVRLFRRS